VTGLRTIDTIRLSTAKPSLQTSLSSKQRRKIDNASAQAHKEPAIDQTDVDLVQRSA
jgi:hypothetical protein